MTDTPQDDGVDDGIEPDHEWEHGNGLRSTGYTIETEPDGDTFVVENGWDREESNLYQHALRELDLLGMRADDEDGPNLWMRNNLLAMIETFAREGHSGASAAYATECLSRLLRYEPLTSLTYTDEEWVKHDDKTWQNKRNPAIFSDDQGLTWFNVNEPLDENENVVKRPTTPTE